MNTENWPNFFVVGAAKAGTTSLYEYLKQHPQVYMSPVKEPHFFSRVGALAGDNRFVRAITDENEYLALFRYAMDYKAIGEASPSYLWDDHAPYRIKQKVPDAKIIILLRDPIERAYSHYLADVREYGVNQTFYEALAQDAACRNRAWGVSHLYVELGQYASQVARYLEVFTPQYVRVYLFDDFKRSPKDTVRDIALFLGLDPPNEDSIATGVIHNAYATPRSILARRILRSGWIRRIVGTVVPKVLRQNLKTNVLLKRDVKPDLDPEAVQYLRAKYEKELKALERTLKRELPSLRKNW